MAEAVGITREKVGNALIGGVDKAVTTRWEAAQKRAAETKGTTADERVRAATLAFARELGVIGAAGGAVAAVPGIGTGASLATGAADIGVFAFRTADLILTIAAIHGHDQGSVEERRAWVLSVLAFGDGAAAGFTKLAGEVGKGIGVKATKRIPMPVIRKVNQAMGRTIITKFGTKRGVIVLGRALPFGIGAAVGGGLNYTMTRTIGRQADKLFKDIALAPPESESATQP